MLQNSSEESIARSIDTVQCFMNLNFPSRKAKVQGNSSQTKTKETQLNLQTKSVSLIEAIVCINGTFVRRKVVFLASSFLNQFVVLL